MISFKLCSILAPIFLIFLVSANNIGTSAGLNLSGLNSIGTIPLSVCTLIPLSWSVYSNSPSRILVSTIVLSNLTPKIDESSISVESLLIFLR